MSLMNLATVFGPSLLRPPVAGLGHDGAPVDISQEVVVQVRSVFCSLSCIYWIKRPTEMILNFVPGAGGFLVPAVPPPP